MDFELNKIMFPCQTLLTMNFVGIECQYYSQQTFVEYNDISMLSF